AARTLNVLDIDLQSMLNLGEGEKDIGVDFCGPVKIQLFGKWCGALHRRSTTEGFVQLLGLSFWYKLLGGELIVRHFVCGNLI
ncbi:unnamed protein product, partial [Musa acuminata var. zebrina]